MRNGKFRILMMQIAIIIAIVALFSVSIFLLLYEQKINYNNITPYEFVKKNEDIQSEKIKRSDIVKYISLLGTVHRKNSEIKEIRIYKSNELQCTVGSIINDGKDISSNNEMSNYFQGRVVEILTTEEEYIVKIDVATNYYIYTFLSDSYASYVPDLQVGNMEIIVQNNYNLLSVSLPNIEYDYSTSQYKLCFQINELDQYTYSQMMVRLRIKDTMYRSATYLDASIIKEIDGKNIIVDKINIMDDNKFDTEKISLVVLDIIDEKIIIEGDEYLTDSFVVYNRYKVSDIN